MGFKSFGLRKLFPVVVLNALGNQLKKSSSEIFLTCLQIDFKSITNWGASSQFVRHDIPLLTSRHNGQQLTLSSLYWVGTIFGQHKLPISAWTVEVLCSIRMPKSWHLIEQLLAFLCRAKDHKLVTVLVEGLLMPPQFPQKGLAMVVHFDGFGISFSFF